MEDERAGAAAANRSSSMRPSAPTSPFLGDTQGRRPSDGSGQCRLQTSPISRTSSWPPHRAAYPYPSVKQEQALGEVDRGSLLLLACDTLRRVARTRAPLPRPPLRWILPP
ncbi:hypothetical protein VPH35_038754 [Triticum aestivum]